MLSCHPEPFAAFVRDLQIPGCDVHLYRGATSFECMIVTPEGVELVVEDESNFYFLPGVRPGLRARASDKDVLKRGMFTLDFDIKKELEKTFAQVGMVQIIDNAKRIIAALEPHPVWGKFRYVVMSGNGMHVHYFGDPTVVVKEEWVAGMKDVFEEVAKITPLPPDYGCGNAGRIMRLPGSWNVKDPTRKLPVEFLAWQPGFTFGDMKYVQERGQSALEEQEKRKVLEKQKFTENHPSGGSTVIDLINSIPIEQVVWQAMSCMPKEKKDGGMRFVDKTGKERGFFKHKDYNIIVHEGTSLFDPPTGVGYNCLGLIKAVLGVDSHGAVQWFAERSTRIREEQARERAEWLEENRAKEVEFFESLISP